jgi:hypothetical protein
VLSLTLQNFEHCPDVVRDLIEVVVKVLHVFFNYLKHKVGVIFEFFTLVSKVCIFLEQLVKVNHAAILDRQLLTLRLVMFLIV